MNVRFQRDDMMKRFQEAGLSGFYLEVVQEGELKAGDRISYTRTNRIKELSWRFSSPNCLKSDERELILSYSADICFLSHQRQYTSEFS